MIHRDPTPASGAWRIPLAVLVVVVLLVVGTMDYNDEVREAKHCAEMVKAGAWPKEVCGE